MMTPFSSLASPKVAMTINPIQSMTKGRRRDDLSVSMHVETSLRITYLFILVGVVAI